MTELRQPAANEDALILADQPYYSTALEVFRAFEGMSEADFTTIVDTLNNNTSHRRTQLVAIDRILFADPEQPEVVRAATIDTEDVIQGQFLGFTLEERDSPNIGITILVNLVPGSSPGIFREETINLWNPEEQALRWANFSYRPPRKIRPWKRLLRTS